MVVCHFHQSLTCAACCVFTPGCRRAHHCQQVALVHCSISTAAGGPGHVSGQLSPAVQPPGLPHAHHSTGHWQQSPCDGQRRQGQQRRQLQHKRLQGGAFLGKEPCCYIPQAAVSCLGCGHWANWVADCPLICASSVITLIQQLITAQQQTSTKAAAFVHTHTSMACYALQLTVLLFANVFCMLQRSAMVGPAGAVKTTTAVGSGLKKDPVVAVLYQHTGRCAVSQRQSLASMPTIHLPSPSCLACWPGPPGNCHVNDRVMLGVCMHMSH